MEILETTQFALLRLASVVCVPLALFTVVTTARRPDPYERYAWGVFSLGLLTLTWLLNAYLNQNSRLLAFVYPLFYGWVALAGPAYYFSLIGRRPRNLSFTLLHLIPAFLVFTSGFIGLVKGPLTHDQLELLFMSSGRISALAWSMLGDTTVSVLFLPVHFGAYALSAVLATKDQRQIALTIPLFAMTCVFTLLYLSPGDTKWMIHIPVIVIEVWAFSSLVYLLLKDTPKVQYDRKSRLQIETIDYDHIRLFFEDKRASEEIFAQPKINIDRLAHISNIEANDWRNYLNDENLSFSELRKKQRIGYAKRLIAEGFLEKYTIDSLTQTIGYSSRTSFYSAYKEVTGENWSRNNS
jgi:AraC-like DNA-binding protein